MVEYIDGVEYHFSGTYGHDFKGIHGYGCNHNCSYCTGLQSVIYTLNRWYSKKPCKSRPSKQLINLILSVIDVSTKQWNGNFAFDAKNFLRDAMRKQPYAFLNSQCDGNLLLKHDQARKTLIGAACMYPQHKYVLLSKDIPASKLDLPNNIWIGVSISRNVDIYKIRVLKMMYPNQACVFFQPLREELTSLRSYHLVGLKHIEIGYERKTGNAGHHITHCNWQWVENIRRLAIRAGIAFPNCYIEGEKDYQNYYIG